MSTPKNSDGGCLAVISSCFKGRNKAKPEDFQSARPTDSVTAASNPSTPCWANAQQHASTPPVTGNPISPPTEVDEAQSATVLDEPSSSIPSSIEFYLATEHSGTQVDLWQEAYDAAEEDTRAWIDESLPDRPENTNPFPELVDLVCRSEEKHEEKAWQFEHGGRPIFLRDYTNKVSSCLTAIGDLAIHFAPAPSPIIWNAVKVLLKVSLDLCGYNSPKSLSAVSNVSFLMHKTAG